MPYRPSLIAPRHAAPRHRRARRISATVVLVVSLVPLAPPAGADPPPPSAPAPAPATTSAPRFGVAQPAARKPVSLPVPRRFCPALIAPAALHLLDIPCVPAWDDCPRDNGERANGSIRAAMLAAADPPRIRRDLPSALASCTVHVALAIALFRRLLASVSTHPRWDAAHFDFAYTQAVRHGDLGMPRADPYVARAFIQSVTRDAPPDPLSGETPRVWPQHARAPLPNVDHLGWLDLEAAAMRARRTAPSGTLPAVLRPEHAPDLRTHLPSMPWLGIYGWQLRGRPWTEFNAPLSWRGSIELWTLDSQHPLTAELVESRATFGNDQARDRIARILIEWRAQYRSRAPGTTEEQRLAAAALNAVESAIAGAQIPVYWSTVLVVVRYREQVVAVLHGSLGAFGRSLARIHAVAVPPAAILAPYAENAVRGAVPFALSRFANYARTMNAAYLIAMVEDDPSMLPQLDAVPHQAWIEATLPPSPEGADGHEDF